MARKRREYTAAERKELWQRWKQGEPIKDIARTLDRASGTIHNTIRERGGVAPPERRRSRLALRLTEREELKALRGEVRELRRANDILKSASAFFAAELDPRRAR